MKHISNAAKVGVLVLLMAGGSFVVWKSIGGRPSGSANYKLWTHLKDASGLPGGSVVMVAGLPVGEISSRSIDGRYARIDLRVRDEIAVWSNAIVFKKSSSLLGNYYIEIDPGSEVSLDAAGNKVTNTRLESGGRIMRVVEATSPDQLMRRIEKTMPAVDKVLSSVSDLSEDMRRIVNGPLTSSITRIDRLIQAEGDKVSRILSRTDSAMARIELITRDIRKATGGVDKRVNKILDEADETVKEARKLMATARVEVENTGKVVRKKLDLVDDVLASSASIATKIDKDQGTLGRLVNDATIADNVEDITEDAKGFIGTLARMQTYVGLRSEFNVFSRLARHYVSVELRTRPDKAYYIEMVKGSRGNYAETDLTFDPTVGGGQWIRRSVIRDEVRFTFQFAKRYKWATFRYGLKESTGGVGLDVNWFDDKLKISFDVFDATFDQLPRLKVAAAYELFRNIYVLGGIDDALNSPDYLDINTGMGGITSGNQVPIQFEEFRFGRDYFLGAMLVFNDQDLAALLTVGGSTLGGFTR